MELHLINDIIILFGIAVVTLFICHKLNIPSLVGYLVTGVIIGPYGFKLISAIEEVEILAEIGIILLLFTIGIEFSLKTLLKIKKSVIIGGGLQVFLTIGAIFYVAWESGLSLNEALFMGFLVSLSSTAIVLKLIQDRGEVDSPHGKNALAILIFQDIIIVPMILITPLIGGDEAANPVDLWLMLAKGIGLVILVIVLARWLVPPFLHQVAKTRSNELFLLVVILMAFGVAGLTSSIGLSLSLGAFLAGLVISESEYSHHAFDNILPFKDIFSSFFFVSIGMLLDIQFLIQNPVTILLITLSVILLKFLIGAFATFVLGYPLRSALLVGFSLSQVGEFAFILAGVGIASSLLSDEYYQIFLSVAVLSMAATPFLIKASPSMANWITEKLPLPPIVKSGFHPYPVDASQPMEKHLVIIGYGVIGKNVARAARMTELPYIILENNPEIVKDYKKQGEPIHFGDPTSEYALENLYIPTASTLIVSTDDPIATRRTAELSRRMNDQLHIIIRTRYLSEMSDLIRLGANEIIPEEYETSIEIFTRVLAKSLVPNEDIEKLVREVRADGYHMLRSISKDKAGISDLHMKLPEVGISTLKVCPHSKLAGHSLEEVQLRKKYGVTILAIKRDDDVFPNPKVNEKILSGDILYVLGTLDEVKTLTKLCKDHDSGNDLQCI